MNYWAYFMPMFHFYAPWGWPGALGGYWMAGWLGVGRCALAGHRPMGISVGGRLLRGEFNFWFSSFLLVLAKLLFCYGVFRHFLDAFYFPEILSLTSFGNSYIPCSQVIIAHRFTCGERKIW